MKNLLFGLISTFILSNSVQAQWTTSGSNIYNSNTGNVGIGTTAPAAFLHVIHTTEQLRLGYDATHYTSFITAANSFTINPISKVLNVGAVFFTSGTLANIDPAANNIPNNLANTGQMLIGWNRTAGSGETDFISNQGAGNIGGFAFYNHDNSNVENQLLCIQGNGNVSIGTTNPNGYKLAVNGSTIATSVTVKLYANWPDYVFKADYKLPALSEVKTYIDQNKHLPELPSAAEVEKDGINLGEMNKALVKKVEELTLYLIDQQKLLQQQKQTLDIQNNKEKVLEERLNQLESLITSTRK